MACRTTTRKTKKLCFTIPEAAALLGFTRNFNCKLARTWQIPILGFGKRIVVTKTVFDKMLEKAMTE